MYIGIRLNCCIFFVFGQNKIFLSLFCLDNPDPQVVDPNYVAPSGVSRCQAGFHSLWIHITDTAGADMQSSKFISTYQYWHWCILLIWMVSHKAKCNLIHEYFFSFTFSCWKHGSAQSNLGDILIRTTLKKWNESKIQIEISPNSGSRLLQRISFSSLFCFTSSWPVFSDLISPLQRMLTCFLEWLE